MTLAVAIATGILWGAIFGTLLFVLGVLFGYFTGCRHQHERDFETVRTGEAWADGAPVELTAVEREFLGGGA